VLQEIVTTSRMRQNIVLMAAIKRWTVKGEE